MLECLILIGGIEVNLNHFVAVPVTITFCMCNVQKLVCRWGNYFILLTSTQVVYIAFSKALSTRWLSRFFIGASFIASRTRATKLPICTL